MGNLLHPSAGRYESLDGMRGVCAVTVALLHFDFGAGLLAKHGFLSVDMFFVLSGFVIALKYEDRLRSPNGFRAFLGARAARLLPVQLLGTIAAIIGASVAYTTHSLNYPGVNSAYLAMTFLGGLLLIPVSLSCPFPVNTPLWSLMAEWLVNIVYGRWLFSARTWLLMLLWAGLTLYLVNHVFSGKRTWELAGTFEWIPCMARAGIGFLAGIVLHRANRRDLLARLPPIDTRLVFGIWMLICFVPDTRPMPVFESVAALIVAPLSVALLIRGERPLPRLYAVLGTLSYPLYASHFALFHLALVLTPVFAGHNPVFILMPASLLLAWGVNHMAATLQARVRRVLRSWQAIPAAPAP